MTLLEPSAAPPPAGPAAGARKATTAPAGKPARSRRPVKAGEPGESWSIASTTMAVIALVCGWLLLQMLVLGGISEQRKQTLLYQEFRAEVAAATAPTGALDYLGNPLQPGTPVATLTIPRFGQTQVVVSGTAPSDLLSGPGHKRDTPLPGQQGISVVMGRGSTYGAPFRHLGELVPGDTISVQNAQGEVTYTVNDVRRAGDPIPAAPTGEQGRLILASSEGSGALSALSPHTAVYVDATTPKAFPDGPLPGSQVPATELPMARDTTGLTTLVLLLGGLVLLVWAISAATRHLRASLVWVFATPCVIAVAWAVTDQVMRLLPNLM